MKKVIFLILIIISNYFILTGQTEQNYQKFKISALADAKEIPLNQQFNVTVTISYIGSPGEYIVSEPYVENYNNLMLMGNSTENVIRNSTENSNLKEVVKNYIYTLKPESLGQAYFPIVRVSISDNKGKLLTELNTQAIAVSIVDPIVQRNYKPLFIITLILLILGAMGYAGFRYYQMIQHKKEEKQKQEEALKLQSQTPEKEFYQEFDNLENMNLMEKLTAVVNLSKKYFEKKYSIKIKDKSTAQIIKLFKENNLVTEETIEKIKEVLTKADLIKFGAENKDEKIINKLIEDIKEIVK